ncbi:GNAT family protein [Larkinella knui]|uniref:N-acetyltransferase n=1 Tax=Larkinella knui TaxID=2025310 RepID=A0A3P1CF68_9BACT|nr:GNAT family protein [Larkinella knui]RRB11534.1 N-acetyltransferase [Larkinella knui]
MELKTDRLVLKELTRSDLEKIHELHSQPEVDEFNTLGIPDNIETTESLLNGWLAVKKVVPRTSFILGIYRLITGDFIGLIALTLGKPNYSIAEVWYKTHPAYWRQGYTSEALNELIRYGFLHLQLHRIEAGCAVENRASIRVLEKAGMTREGRKRKILPLRGTWTDAYFYSILETEFDPISKNKLL